MNRRDIVWAVAFEGALARSCMRDGQAFVAPDANDIVWAKKWADFATFHFDRHGNVQFIEDASHTPPR